MKFIKKYSLYISGLGIIALYFFTRFYNILSLPIFTDEAIYIRWAQIAGTDGAQRFISLTDGKQPSFVWIAAVLLRVINEPLLAGRLVSVIAGLGSMIGIFFLTSEIFKNNSSDTLRAEKIGLTASFVYVIYPFSLIYDRLAIYDSLVAMFIIWALYFTVLLVRKIRLDIAMILGITIGAGMLTKTSNNFAFILLPLSLLIFDFKDKKWKSNLVKFCGLALVSVIIAHVIYSILRLSPYFYIIAQKNDTFVYPIGEWISQPFAFFGNNIKGLSEWLVGYVTAPFLVLALSSFLIGKRFLREKIFLLLWFIIPFTALAFFGKVIYPRFILFMTMPILILGAYSLYSLVGFAKNIYVKCLIIAVFLEMFLINDFLILTDFDKAYIPQSDKNQFIASWPSGVGVNETISFLTDKAREEQIYVGTQGTFGLMPYALEIYLKDNSNIKTAGFWPIGDSVPKEALEIAKSKPTYFVFYQPCGSCKNVGVAPSSWPVKQIFQIPKLEKDSYYTLYQIIPQ